MVQGVLLTLAFNLYYQEAILYSLTEKTATIKSTRSEAEIKPQDEAKKIEQKEMLLQIPILAQYCNFIMNTRDDTSMPIRKILVSHSITNIFHNI